MDQIDCLNVTNFSKCKQSNGLTMPNNQVCALTACKHLPRAIHVQNKRVDNVTKDITLRYTWTDRPVTSGLQETIACLQPQRVQQLPKLTPTVHPKVKLEIIFCLQQSLLT
jgi:hypothetical protein